MYRNPVCVDCDVPKAMAQIKSLPNRAIDWQASLTSTHTYISIYICIYIYIYVCANVYMYVYAYVQKPCLLRHRGHGVEEALG